MTDSEKARILQLDDKINYALRCLRVESFYGSMKLTAAFTLKEFPAGLDSAKFAEQRLKASVIIVNTLDDHALRVLKAQKGDSVEMLEKLDARYDSKTTASKI